MSGNPLASSTADPQFPDHNTRGERFALSDTVNGSPSNFPPILWGIRGLFRVEDLGGRGVPCLSPGWALHGGRDRD
jgi:hypothetical protein